MFKYGSFLGVLAGCFFLSLPADAKIHEFTINQPRELDFVKLDEVFRVRKKMVQSFPIFFSGTYDPTKSPAFSQVVGGKPWWGVKGMACYGPGEVGIRGVSEESRVIDNPFSLISIEEGSAHRIMTEKGNCPSTYTQLVSLNFNDETRTFTATYNISKHLNTLENLSKGISRNFDFSVNGLNAIDFGVQYGFVQSSKNISFNSDNNISKKPHRFLNYIHVGPSCGYSGGCNNGSPHQPELDFKIIQFPAQVNLKLWKKEPKSKEDKPFLMYKIIIK